MSGDFEPGSLPAGVAIPESCRAAAIAWSLWLLGLQDAFDEPKGSQALRSFFVLASIFQRAWNHLPNSSVYGGVCKYGTRT